MIKEPNEEIPIVEIGFDEHDRLFVKPASGSFECVYRTAVGASWDDKKLILFELKSSNDLNGKFLQILLSAVKSEYGINLVLTEKTKWINVFANLKDNLQKQHTFFREICKVTKGQRPNIEVIDLEYEPSSFGSWRCKVKKGKNLYRLTFDGKDSWYSVERQEGLLDWIEIEGVQLGKVSLSRLFHDLFMNPKFV